MRHTKFNRIVQMAIWQKRAACISFTPELAQKPIVVRLITPARNPFYGLIIDRFGHRATHITLRGLGIDIEMVDRWINTCIDRVSMVEMRQMDLEQSRTQPLEEPQVDRRFVKWTVCNPWQVSEIIASLQDRKDSAARRKMLERLAANPFRMLPRVSQEHIEAVRTMALSFPNFNELTTEIIQDLSLKMRIGEALSLPHLLLHGPPGTGKSLFARRIAEVLGFHYREFSFAQLTGGFLLTGSSDRWMSSTVGILAEAVISAPGGKVPLIFGDEIDKAVPGRSYPADTALLNVLEPSSAATFTDEYLECAIDFRPVSIMLAANVIANIKPELLSRVTQVHVREPADDEMPAVIRSVDRALRDQFQGLETVFEPLSDSVIGHLTSMPPRALYRTLKRAYAVASERSPVDGTLARVLPEHLGDIRNKAASQKNGTPASAVTNDELAEYITWQAILRLQLNLWNPGRGRPQ